MGFRDKRKRRKIERSRQRASLDQTEPEVSFPSENSLEPQTSRCGFTDAVGAFVILNVLTSLIKTSDVINVEHLYTLLASYCYGFFLAVLYDKNSLFNKFLAVTMAVLFFYFWNFTTNPRYAFVPVAVYLFYGGLRFFRKVIKREYGN